MTTRRDCYTALQAIHSQWQQLDARLRDYIGSQKFNGYQALHTTVFGYDGLFDVHIRTHEMQLIADHGPVLLGARQQGSGYSSRTQALTWIEQVRSWQRELSLSATQLVEAVRGDLFQDQIFILTPKGDIKDLADGATALDLAYRIHTELGHHCAGAKVTGSDNITRLEERDYELRSGEIVEIMRDDAIQPTASWLRSAKTRHTHDAILHFLHAHNLPTEEIAEHDLIQSGLLKHARLGWCCEPGPDDELVGLSSGRRLVVHRLGCRYTTHPPVVRHTKQKAQGKAGSAPKKSPPVAASPCLRVRWEALRPDLFRASLEITASDREGLMHDVSGVMTAEDLNLVRVGGHTLDSRVKATIWVTVEVKRSEQLQRACRRLMGIDGVVSVERRHRIPVTST